MNAFEWTEATSVDQAVAQLGEGVVLKAGGVDLLDLMKEHLVEPKRLVNIRNIVGLDKVEHDERTGLKLGPLVTLAQLDAHPLVRSRYVALADAAGNAATPQIRNMASLGGNLVQRPRCWYFRNEQFHCKKKGGDICYAQRGENQYHAIFNNDPCAIVHPSAAATPLVAYGATLELTSPKGKREILAEQFFQLPDVDVHRENVLAADEMITAIKVPVPAPGTRAAYTKQGEKESQDWPIAEVVAVLEMDGETCKKASIVLGAASPVPHRAKEAESVLVGKKIDEALAREAAKNAIASADPLSENRYKLGLFEVIIRRTILAAQGGRA
ncbi:MAG TPA: FAD binding domain-containing protein [Tepidisphaeraceae bacterium]|jgi:xanthine dehydrogenase YagS FAD-binding subunit